MTTLYRAKRRPGDEEMSPQDQFAADAMAVRLLHAPLSLRRDPRAFRDCAIIHPRGDTGVTIHRRVFEGGAEEFQVSVHGEPWQTWEMRDGEYGPASFPRSKWASRMEAVSAVVERTGVSSGPIPEPKPTPTKKPKPTTYAEAAERLGNRLTLNVQNNTKLVRLTADTIALRLHRTNIVEWSEDGSIVLYTGGWFTSVTEERINAYTPRGVRVSGKKDSARTREPAEFWTCSSGVHPTRPWEIPPKRSVEFGRSERVRVGPRGGLRII